MNATRGRLDAVTASEREIERAYTRYGPALVRKAVRMLGSESEALDVVHELFTRLLEKNTQSVELPYLYAAVNRRCLNRLRDRKNRRRLLELHDNGMMSGVGVPLEGQMVGRDLLIRLLERLTPSEAEVLSLCFMDGFRQEDAARALLVSRRTVGHRIARIRRAARALQAETHHA